MGKQSIEYGKKREESSLQATLATRYSGTHRLTVI